MKYVAKPIKGMFPSGKLVEVTITPENEADWLYLRLGYPNFIGYCMVMRFFFK